MKEKKGERTPRQRGKGEKKAVAVRERYTEQERRRKGQEFLESYEISEAVKLWELGRDWRGNPWQRVKSFFREMSEYERAAESGCNAKYGEEILKEI